MYSGLPYVRQSVANLQKRMRQTTDSLVYRRLHLLYLIKTETARDKGKAAAILGIHRNTVGAWCKEYQRDGIRGLCRIETAPGAKPALTAQDRKRLGKRLASPEGFGSYAEAQAWIEKELQVTLSIAATFYWVHIKCGAAPKVARPSHEKKMPLLRRAFPNA